MSVRLMPASGAVLLITHLEWGGCYTFHMVLSQFGPYCGAHTPAAAAAIFAADLPVLKDVGCW